MLLHLLYLLTDLAEGNRGVGWGGVDVLHPPLAPVLAQGDGEKGIRPKDLALEFILVPGPNNFDPHVAGFLMLAHAGYGEGLATQVAAYQKVQGDIAEEPVGQVHVSIRDQHRSQVVAVFLPEYGLYKERDNLVHFKGKLGKAHNSSSLSLR